MTSELPSDRLDDELRADALDVLRDALEWRLAGRRWTAVGTAVGALSTAWRAGDVASLRNAVYELELAGPVRATPVGEPSMVEPPEPVREEINELIFALDEGQDA